MDLPGIEPGSPGCEPSVLPLYYRPSMIIYFLKLYCVVYSLQKVYIYLFIFVIKRDGKSSVF